VEMKEEIIKKKFVSCKKFGYREDLLQQNQNDPGEFPNWDNCIIKERFLSPL